MQIVKEVWGTVNGQTVYLITLKNAAGSIVKLTNYGARIVAVKVPDRYGQIDDVVLGFDSLTPYLEDKHFIGATIGRFANRISNARFPLDDKIWILEANEGPHCNHSGRAGFDHLVFDILEMKELHTEDGPVTELGFYLTDKHGNGGFPGNLKLKISYRWAEQTDQLKIIYEGWTDRRGILNLTNHSYFNLSGSSESPEHYVNCLMHRLEIMSDSVLEMSQEHIPTGRRIAIDDEIKTGTIGEQCIALAANAGSVLASGAAEKVGSEMFCRSRVEPDGGSEKYIGMNNCFELRQEERSFGCILTCDTTGREMEIKTSYPGLLIYTGDSLQSQGPGYLGRPYKPFDGVALECQYYPDSPNQPTFPTAIIEQDKPYCEYITYRFYTKKHSNN
jgi:aldose 1-epimerase